MRGGILLVSKLNPEIRTRVEQHMRGNCLYEDLPVKRYEIEKKQYIFQEVPYSSYVRYELYNNEELTEIGTLDIDEDLTSQRDYYDASLCKEFENPESFKLCLECLDNSDITYKRR